MRVTAPRGAPRTPAGVARERILRQRLDENGRFLIHFDLRNVEFVYADYHLQLREVNDFA